MFKMAELHTFFFDSSFLLSVNPNFSAMYRLIISIALSSSLAAAAAAADGDDDEGAVSSNESCFFEHDAPVSSSFLSSFLGDCDLSPSPSFLGSFETSESGKISAFKTDERKSIET